MDRKIELGNLRIEVNKNNNNKTFAFNLNFSYSATIPEFWNFQWLKKNKFWLMLEAKMILHPSTLEA